MWGATCVRTAVACAHARPMVARLLNEYAERRKVGLQGFEEFDRRLMGEDVNQAQKFFVDTARGRHDGWEEGQDCSRTQRHFEELTVIIKNTADSLYRAQACFAHHPQPPLLVAAGPH